MTVAVLSILFIAIIAFEVPGLLRKKMWRELAAFSVLLLLGMLYSFGQALEVPLPNPTRGIMTIFEPVSLIIEKLLS